SSAMSARNRPIAHTPGSLPAGSEPAPRRSPWRVAANEAADPLSAGSEPAPRSGGRFRRRLQPHAGDREEPDGSARPQPRTPLPGGHLLERPGARRAGQRVVEIEDGAHLAGSPRRRGPDRLADRPD